MKVRIDFASIKRTQATTTEKLDITHVFWCKGDNECFLRRDLIKGKCPRCAGTVADISDSPVARAWLLMIKPKPIEKGAA